MYKILVGEYIDDEAVGKLKEAEDVDVDIKIVGKNLIFLFHYFLYFELHAIFNQNISRDAACFRLSFQIE